MNRESKLKRIAWMQNYHKTRGELLYNLLSRVGGPLIGAVIGVWDGDYVIHLMKTYPRIVRLYGIDPYTVYFIKGRQVRGWDALRWHKMYVASKKKIENALGDRFILIREKSENCADKIPMMHFVQIDGASSFYEVTENITLYEKRIVSGGVMCGDLYHAKHQFVDGVKDAVDTYAACYQRDLQTDKESWMWWWYKP